MNYKEYIRTSMRIFLSIILLIILIPATLLALAGASLRWSVATPGFINKEIERQEVSRLLQDEIVVSIKKVPFEEDSGISDNNIRPIVLQIFPEIWIRESLESVVNDAFKWLYADKSVKLSLKIPLSDPKEELLAVTSEPKIRKFYKGMGIDAPKMVGLIPESFDLADPKLPVLSLGEDADTSLASTSKELAASAATLRTEAEKAKDVFQRAVRYYFYFLAAYITLFLLYLGVIAKNAKSFYFSLGAASLLNGGVVVLAAFVLRALYIDRVIPKILSNLSSADETLRKTTELFLSDIGNAFFIPIFAGGALIFFAGWYFLAKEKEAEEPLHDGEKVIRPDNT